MVSFKSLPAVWLAMSLWSTGVFAKAPAEQGRACDAAHRCDGKLQCVAHPYRKSTCELLCKANATCPEDQRCVKDGAQSVCRPIDDSLGM